MKASRVPVELVVGALALALAGVVCATVASCAPPVGDDHALPCEPAQEQVPEID